MRRTSTQKQPIVEDVVIPPKQAVGAVRIPPFGLVLAAIILLTAAALGVKQVWFKSPPKPVQTSVPADAGQAGTPESIRGLIDKVAKHIVLKAGEDPTVATIQDVEILKRQNPVFYKDAQNGDRLLIWSDKAVLYSQDRDIILAVLPISLPPTALGEKPADASASSTLTAVQNKEEATVEVRNGTGTPGMAKAMSDKLAKLGLEALKPTDAGKKDYAQTIVVKLTDKELPLSLQAINSVAGTSQSVQLPAEESPSKADFLVIVGADFKK